MDLLCCYRWYGFIGCLEFLVVFGFFLLFYLLSVFLVGVCVFELLDGWIVMFIIGDFVCVFSFWFLGGGLRVGW